MGGLLEDYLVYYNPTQPKSFEKDNQHSQIDQTDALF